MSNRNKGFALLETLISVLIVSFGVLALFKFQANLHNGQRVSTYRTEALVLAQAVINQVAGSAVPADYGSGTDQIPGKSATYTRTWAVTTGALEETLILSQTTWTDATGVTDKVVLNSIVAKDVALNQGKLLASLTPIPPGATSASTAVAPWTKATSVGTTPVVPPVVVPPVVVIPTDTVPPIVTPPATLTISGAISFANNNYSIGAVTISATNGGACTKASLSIPYGYSCVVPFNWTGQVNANVGGGGQASPGFRAYTNIAVSYSGQSFSVN